MFLMFLIVRSGTKRKFIFGLKILVTLIVLGLVFTHIYNMYQGPVAAKAGWLKEDRPHGNPMRVEKTEQQEVKSDKEHFMDEFVVKLQDFYRKDR